LQQISPCVIDVRIAPGYGAGHLGRSQAIQLVICIGCSGTVTSIGDLHYAAVIFSAALISSAAMP
jgi:hypothetical protein